MRNFRKKDNRFAERFAGRTHRMNKEGHIGVVKSAHEAISEMPSKYAKAAADEKKKKAEEQRI